MHAVLLTLPLLLAYVPGVPCTQEQAQQEQDAPQELESLRRAAALIGLDFAGDELSMMRGDVLERRSTLERLRSISLDNGEYPVLVFTPRLPGMELRRVVPTDRQFELEANAGGPIAAPDRPLPEGLESLAYASIRELAAWIRAGQLSCVDLTKMHLARLERIDRELHCVIELTPERALAQAEALDREIAAGQWRGPLHGIPWGAKDLFAVRGTHTTWGAKPFEKQRIDRDATVVQRLDEAGAILIAKLSLGALAMGDVWFGGRTRSPWNPERGSSGSSAGSASATAAGGVVFALGTETLGSIVSPSRACGTSALRPTFGRVSRDGAMALSWTMDKVGPIARSAEDCHWVMQAIAGADEADPSSAGPEYRAPAPETWDLAGIRVGIPAGVFGDDHPTRAVLEELEGLGAVLSEIELPELPAGDLLLILHAEAACAFDELTHDGRDDQLVRQTPDAWPNSFRSARLIPAVEYLRAQRLRGRLMHAVHEALAEVDVLVHPPYAGGVLTITNLTGHPTFVAPCGFRDNGLPRVICFTGQLFDDERLLALVAAWQAATEYEDVHPGPKGFRAPLAEDSQDGQQED